MPDPLAQTPDAPDMQGLPASGGQMPPLAAPQPTVQPPAGTPDKHSLLGRGVMAILHSIQGNQVNYVPDPATGDVKPVVTRRGPGQIFRDVLAGALIGDAAAAHSGADSPLAGAGIGGAAEMQQKQQQDNQARSRAMDSAEKQKAEFDKQATQKKQDDLAAAQVAHSTISGLEFDRHANMYNDKQIMSHNLSGDVVKDQIMKNGGVAARIPGADGNDLNGVPGNGGKLMQMFNQDPAKVMQAPEGYHRVHLANVDTNGLEHKGNKWIDPKTGQEVDLADRTTHYLMDLPNAAWNKSVTLTKGTVNDVAGYPIAQGKDTDSVSTKFGDMFGLRLKNIQDLNAQRQDLYPNLKNKEDYATFKAQVQQTLDDPKSTPEQKARAEKQVSYADDWAQAHGDIVKSEKNVTATQIKQETEQFEKDLTAGTITPENRATLLARQQEQAVKGVPEDIIASIGPKPVPAQFIKGRDDPAYKESLKLWGDASLNKKTAMAAASGLARYQMLGDIRDYNITNTSGQDMDLGGGNVIHAGETGRVTANQLRVLPPGALLNTQDGTKIMSKQAALGDIDYNIKNLRASLPAIDDLDAGTKLKLITALRDPDPSSALKNLMTTEAKEFNDPKVQTALNDLQYMAENVMLLRSIQGVGGAGSDMMRHALLALIPGPTSIGIKGYGAKQLDRLEGTLAQLKKGVPTLSSQSSNGKAVNTPPAGASDEVKKDGVLIGHVVTDPKTRAKKFVALTK